MQEKIGENFYDFAGDAESNKESVVKSRRGHVAKMHLIHISERKQIAGSWLFCSV
jgi:hypothetical protein